MSRRNNYLSKRKGDRMKYIAKSYAVTTAQIKYLQRRAAEATALQSGTRTVSASEYLRSLIEKDIEEQARMKRLKREVMAEMRAVAA